MSSPHRGRTPSRGGPLRRLGQRLEQRSRWQDKSRRERGVVVVWFALMLIVLLGFAGFAVDMSNWWFQAERLQRGADASAHAGVVFLPADVPGATTTARAEAAKNGFTTTGAGANATIAVSQEPNPNRLRVKITTEVPTYFVGLLGVESVTLTREAVAEYVSPVPMGSPENRLGNDPEIGYNPQLWSMVGGPNSYKHWGDRYQAKRCQLGGGYNESNCTASSTPQNDDYATDGYIYALEVKEKVAGQPLTVQIYDPAFVDTGSQCDTIFMSTTQTSALASWNATRYSNAATRYAGTPNAFCSGDIGHEGTNINTSFVVRAPDNTEWSDTDNPVIDSGNCRPQSFKFYDPANGTAIYNWLRSDATESVVNNVAPWSFAEVFHRWVTVCSIDSANVNVGTYILQIRTNATAAAPTVYNASVATGGHNRFSIRAGFGTAGLTAVDGSKLTISARGRLPLFTNATAANASFFLARVRPYDAGRTLRVSLFDMGDVTGGAGTLQIIPPAEFATTFSGCVFSREGSSAGALVTTPSTCTLSSVSAANGYQGKLVTIDVPIPQNYTCTESSPTGCWIKVKANFPGGVNDVTTWSAAILGNPVRLVE